MIYFVTILLLTQIQFTFRAIFPFGKIVSQPDSTDEKKTHTRERIRYGNELRKSQSESVCIATIDYELSRKQ